MFDRSSLTLLLIDDCEEDRHTYRCFLEQDSRCTYRITECGTAIDALHLCQQDVPQVVLLSESLSSGNGSGLLQQIRQIIPASQMAVILLAEQEDFERTIAAMKGGAQNYLIKTKLTASLLHQAVQDAMQGLMCSKNPIEHYQLQQSLMGAIALRIRQSLQLDEILSTTTEEVRQFLKTDRVLVYQFHADWSGTIVAESVLPGWTVALGSHSKDTYFEQEGAIAYKQGRKQIVEDITQAGLADCHQQFLQQLEVKAVLVVPILVENTLWGLLVAHHCVAPRRWQTDEVDLLENLAVQIAIAIQQASAYQQARVELEERIQVEKSLRESEERFRSTFEQVAVGLAHVSPEGQFIRLNQRFCDITGYAASELLSLTFQEITHPDDLVSDLRQMQRLLAGKIQTYSVEKRYIRKNRRLVWINLTFSLVRGLQGEPKYFIAVIEDITARKQAEAERLQAEKVKLELQLLDDILDTILAGYWDADIPTHQQYISPGFKRMFGYEDHELANSPDTWKHLVFPEDLPGALAKFEDHVRSRGKVPYYNELRYRHKNGSTVWVMCSGRVIVWDKDGNPLRMIGCHVDITQRKQAEEALAHYASEIEDLYNNAPCGYHSLDPDGRILNVNDTELRWLGYCREEMLGHPITHFMTEAGIQTFQTAYPTFQEQGVIKDLEFDLICKDGTLFPVLVSATAVKSAAGTYLHSRSTLFDLRDRKQAEIQLRQMNQQLAQTNGELARATRMKDEFLANMSHELRTPLNAILGMSESLLEEVLGTLAKPQEKAISTIERSGQHLLGLINDILDLSKIEAGKIELEITTVSIAQLCQSSLSFVKQQAFKKQIQLNLAIASNLGEMLLDERRIRQVLINLLTNAVKFTLTGGQVTLEAHYEPMEVNLAERIPVSRPAHLLASSHPYLKKGYDLCISVIDTGIGIATADQTKLFQPFVQIDSKLNRQYEGTGLGLVLVKRIVEMHGGDVSFRSEPGQGSCFTVRLPSYCDREENQPSILSSPPQPIQPPAPPDLSIPQKIVQQTGKGITPSILLAEDNEDNINSISNYLQAKGYRILVAKNGEDAIALTQSHHPDLILMDIQMPKVDGIEAIQRIRQDPQLASIPIIALTALAMKGDRERCLTAGANDYLAKPVRLRQLADTVQHWLDNIAVVS